MIDPCGFNRPTLRLGALLVALSASAIPAAAAPPKEALVTRELQDLYRAGTGEYYLKTIGCNEQIYGDRVVLRWNMGIRGGTMTTRANRTCVIERVLREVDPANMLPKTNLY